MFSSKKGSRQNVVTINFTVFCDLKCLSLILRVSRDNTVFPVQLLPHRNNIFSGFSTGIGKCQSAGNSLNYEITDSSQQPGDVTVHTETESHHNDSRVKLTKCLIREN